MVIHFGERVSIGLDWWEESDGVPNNQKAAKIANLPRLALLVQERLFRQVW